MSVDSKTMVIITAVGGAGVAAGRLLWSAVTLSHRKNIGMLEQQAEDLKRRTSECEEDRKLLHGRLNDQGERITQLSLKIGRLEGQMRRDQ
jgi:hypothetical protein